MESIRRFFSVDMATGTARYVAAFEKGPVPPPVALAAGNAFELAGVCADLLGLPSDVRLAVEPLESLDAEFDQRFLKARDGANGRMSVRWGKRGPRSENSSGLN